MLDTLFSGFRSLLFPTQSVPLLGTDVIPSYPKTVEEAFRRDWEAIGGNMRKAMEKSKTNTDDQQHSQNQGDSHGKHAPH